MQTVDLISFLKNFYGIAHEKLSFDNLTHEDILELFPFIEKCNIEDINFEDVACGNIIGVYDKHQRVEYYHNPHINVEKIGMIIVEDKDNSSKKFVFTIEDLENLSKEELLALRRKLRLNDQRKESYMINALIKKNKRKEPKEYRKKKEKMLIKERMNYDD